MILPMKNKYIYHLRITEAKFREILKLFSQKPPFVCPSRYAGFALIQKRLKSVKFVEFQKLVYADFLNKFAF